MLTLVSRSLSATISELTGQPTPPELHVPGPSIVAPIIGTTETLPSLVASSEQAAPVIDPNQTASASLLATEGHIAQSLGSDDDGTRFQLAPHTSVLDSSTTAPPTDP